MKEYFISAHVNKHGNTYKLTRAGRSMTSVVKLYINGDLVCTGTRAAMAFLGKNWK